MNSGERIKNLIAKFVLKYNYWGYLFSRVRRHPSKSLPSIMGVAPEKDGTLTLYYHPDLVEKTDDNTLIKIIEHEGLHILNKHIPRLVRILANEISPLNKNFKSMQWNIAADCVVNSQAGLPKTLTVAGTEWSLCHPEAYGFEKDKVTEYYYLELLQKTPPPCKCFQNGGKGKDGSCKDKNGNSKDGNQDKSGDKDENEGSNSKQECKCFDKIMKQIGDHTGWTQNIDGAEDLSSLSRKLDQHTKRIIRESAKTFQKDRGNLPGYLKDLIQGALLPPKAPYYQIIRNLVRGSRFCKFQRSPTRINRKRTYAVALSGALKDLPQISPFPGKMRDYTFDIGVVIDTSGSMSNDEVREGLSGIKDIIEKDRYCKTTVMEVDTEIHKEYVCKKVKDIQFDVKGRGGTTLGPGLFRAKELGVDVCLVFTDGGTENFSEYPRRKLPKKIIWVITGGGSARQVRGTGVIVKI
jgi:predicted metal-dependent peptidase